MKKTIAQHKKDSRCALEDAPIKEANKLQKDFIKLSKEVAEVSAHEWEANNWWGNDTELGDVPFAIRKLLLAYADKEFERGYLAACRKNKLVKE